MVPGTKSINQNIFVHCFLLVETIWDTESLTILNKQLKTNLFRQHLTASCWKKKHFLYAFNVLSIHWMYELSWVSIIWMYANMTWILRTSIMVFGNFCSFFLCCIPRTQDCKEGISHKKTKRLVYICEWPSGIFNISSTLQEMLWSTAIVQKIALPS